MIEAACHCLNIRLTVSESYASNKADQDVLRPLKSKAIELSVEGPDTKILQGIGNWKAGRIVAQDIVSDVAGFSSLHSRAFAVSAFRTRTD